MIHNDYHMIVENTSITLDSILSRASESSTEKLVATGPFLFLVESLLLCCCNAIIFSKSMCFAL